MAQVIIALGSNLNDPHRQLITAKEFLEALSEAGVLSSSVYKSEPVGPSEDDFLNAVIKIDTDLSPSQLFNELKKQEKKQGRPSRYPKWTSRTIDLDIIAYDDLVLETDNLIIPHAEYKNRLFVLLPLKEVLPDWKDKQNAQTIEEMIENAPQIRIEKTKLAW
ncbi:MAG: 2-amino-4-hydroxy-6-hydroxymethyldihydropteridine diphosphokinase [Balneola sp.]|nr:2-amino-4-hydroxy-6-hydroxymethyldihydropteridine diphosphokinase [Balneola sp.]MBO6652206.1 2-amino-4-hydroxy-6-hydroxymethyldihydropteridine diphosphokinase [Balneola sp.]MBO6712676.1 2-amino-4-hydroxy-6-hydroxymethyldihydropteridine diphosphokinase [Balneola sp.]MBO6801338.1 2-amino-4-hydroxy-6-hydroxymethyldihydropteridine diphosphokinase [Balneola sp.]MBO6870503.1 2-amino-4-hydroxy-6-hydroxymethyldihydropteridine diphosphokinase [Balneola sp.]